MEQFDINSCNNDNGVHNKKKKKYYYGQHYKNNKLFYNKKNYFNHANYNQKVNNISSESQVVHSDNLSNIQSFNEINEDSIKKVSVSDNHIENNYENVNSSNNFEKVHEYINNSDNNIDFDNNNQNNYIFNNKKRKLLSVLGVVIIVIALFGVTYAMYNYSKTGLANTINVGRIAFRTNQSNNQVSLTNIIPISSSDVLTDEQNVGVLNIDISGDTEYADGVEYLLTAVDVNNTINNKTVPISIMVTYEEKENKDIGTSDDAYFTNRGGSSSVYKVLASDKVSDDGRLLVGYIKPDQAGIDGVLTIHAYIDSDDIIVSDTYEGQTNKVVLTTGEWNSFVGSNALSFKVKVEASKGIWVEDNTPLPAICRAATTLNKETCGATNASQGCRKAGYQPNEEIEYGNLVDSNTYSSGDAFDCDVDGTGFNQRFYYLRTVDDKAVLISNTNYEGVNGQQTANNFTYDIALTKLPTATNQWTNLPVTYTHDGDDTVYAARLVTMDDLIAAADKTNLTDDLSLSNVQFLFENSGFAINGGRSTQWIQQITENNTTTRYRYHKNSVSVVAVGQNDFNTSSNCVRPVIEVPLNRFEQFVAPTPTPTPTATPTPTQYQVEFHPEGGSTVNPINVNAGSAIGSLMPQDPTRENYVFDGWYDSTYTTKIDSSTVVDSKVDAYAKWKASVALATVPSSIIINVGNTETITVTPPSNYDLESYTFSTSDSSKATVNSETGVVTGVAIGSSVITITGTQSNLTKTVTVTVQTVIYPIYTVDFDSEGGSTVSDVFHVQENEKLGELPDSPTKVGHVFNGWYTSASGGVKINEETIITGNITFHAQWDELVCMKATSLHTLDSVSFGTLPGNNTISAGFAYDCKVQTTGNYSERFYYLATTDDISALIYYNNVHQDNGNLVAKCNADGLNYSSNVTTGPAGIELPTTSQWDNVSLHTTPRQLYNESGTTTFGNNTLGTAAYTGKAARLATLQEISQATGVAISNMATAQVLSSYKYLFENTNVLTPSGTSPVCRSNYWLETPKESGSNVFRIDGADSSKYNVANALGASTKTSATRPVIEVPKRLIEGVPIIYNVSFNSRGGSSVPDREVVADGQLGTLPADPIKSGFIFDGWYTSTDWTTQVDSSRVIHDNVEFFAKWVEGTSTLHTVTFNLDGGTMPVNEESTRQIVDGSAIGQLPIPTKTNYTFDGWYLVDLDNHLSTYSVFIDSSHTVSEDEEYIANWIYDNYVAAIGNNYYETLASAVSAITTSTPTTIRILKDITMTTVVTIPANRDITLDIGNYVLSDTATNVFVTNGILRIHDGTVRATAGFGAINVNGTGELYVSGGRIENTSTRQAIYNKGKVYISGTAYLTTSASARAAVQNDNTDSTNPIIEISGGTIIATSSSCERGAVQNVAGGTVIVTGGTITSNSTNNNSGGIQNAGTLIIGTQNLIHDTSSPVIQGVKYGVNTSTNISFYDGILKGKTDAINNESKITGVEDNTNKVNGTEGDYKTLYYELASGNKVTFDANGGEVSPQSITVAENAQVGQLPTPIRTGYIFDGWYLDTTPAYQTLILPTRVPQGQEEYIAKWIQDVTNATVSNQSITLNGLGTSSSVSVTNASSIETFTYESSDPFTATVDSNGVITSVAPGRAIIRLVGDLSGEKKNINVVVNLDNNTPTFDIMPTAMRTYFDNIDDWAAGQTDNDHSKYDAAMSANLLANDCVNFNGDDRANQSTTTGTTFCDQPNQYDTGETGTINVYEYDTSTGQPSQNQATYVSNNNGKLYNFIPGKVYYWEKDGDSSINGKVFIYGERRIITINNAPTDTFHQIRNVRDLGGIKVDTNGDGTIDGTIKYGRLYRGEKVWRGTSVANTQTLFGQLGVTHEMDLRKSSEPIANEEATIGTLVLNSDTPSNTKTYEVIHYEIDYTNDPTYYALARKAVTDIMDNFIAGGNGYSMYFHCRIGSDRTGMIAYLLEGLLGASLEDIYRDYEMSAFFGIDERTRFYYNKGSNVKKFIYMKNAIKAANSQGDEDIVAWYMKGSTNVAADNARISQFRQVMIDYYS